MYMKVLCPLVIISYFTFVRGEPQIQSLNGQWTARGLDNDDNEIEIQNATVPGGIFSDLMNNDIIGDIFYGTGDTDYKWVGEHNWTYSTTFIVDQDFLARQYVVLIFEGLDTFATISLNDVEIATTNNMFVRYIFDVKEQLQVGTNELSVFFASPVETAATLANELNNSYVIPPECHPDEYNGICHVNLIRKMQASFAWEWGPAFASVGIWKDVYLESFQELAIERVDVTSLRNNYRSIWSIVVTIYVIGDVDDAIAADVNITLNLGDKRVPLKTVKDYSVEKRILEGEILLITGREVSFDDVNLWWPNGYGTQDLYDITATVIGQNDTDEQTVKIGFRTIELIQEELETGGSSFLFVVNNQSIFAKGANEIPISILPEKGQDPETVQKLLQTVRDTNMNMLRVWGGGVYESDYFYDLADEYGILIWQDFMFACAMYSADDDFLNTVYDEINHQLKRLRRHPSIAIWAGNNENEAALSDNWYNTTNNFDQFKSDYVKLYVDLIQPEVYRDIVEPPYLKSSPTNGVGTDKEDHVADNPYDPLYGDIHFYDYTQDSWNVSTFPIPRFASEYGYQSYPSRESWLTATDNDGDIGIDSDFMKYRQHHPDGNQQNLDLINMQLPLPDPPNEGFVDAFIYYSQIMQAQSIKIQTEHYRSFKGRVDESGRGNTTGALYWQLNDVWVAPTWSGLDYTGRWKMLQYFTKDFFNPMIITGRLSADDSLEVYAIYDGIEVPDVSVRAVVYVYRWDSFNSLISIEFPVTLDPLVSVLVTTVDAQTALTTAGCGNDYNEAKANCFFHLHLLDEDNNELAPPNYVFLEKLKDSNIPDANIVFSPTAADEEGKNFNIEITTDVVTLFVWLDSHDIRGQFSENGFLQVQATKTVTFIADESITAEELGEALTITHYHDPF